MPLSVSKLKDLLLSKGFVSTKFFILDNLVFFIELFSVTTSQYLIMYIPSKYEFTVSPEDVSFKLEYVNVDVADNTADEYGVEQDGLDLDKKYGGVQLSPSKGDKLEASLVDGYKHEITINSLSKEDKTGLKSINRQIRRLVYSVQNIKYKIGIFWRNYFLCVRRDNTFSCFTIKGFPRSDTKKLSIITDLEVFYEKNDQILPDIKVVRASIYNILDKNQGNHSSVINNIISNKKELINIPNLVHRKKIEYDIMLDQLEKMLEVLISSELGFLAELEDLEKIAPTGLQNDITRAHGKSKIEKELAKINNTKAQIASNITAVQSRKDSAVLSVDELMFNSSIMLDGLVQNFAKLKDFC